MKKRGSFDQFFKPAPAGPLQQDQVEQDAPLPEQQSPPPPPPPKKVRTAHQQDPAAAIYIKRYRSVRWGSTGGAISDQDRLLMINEPWMPPPGYHFPLLKDGQHRRAFQAKWLQLYHWARYSPSHQGVFCVACVLFGQDEATPPPQVSNMFVSEPINRFKKGLDHLNDHGSKTSHKVRTKNIRINRNC